MILDEMKDMRREINDNKRQLYKACLEFSGKGLPDPSCADINEAMKTKIKDWCNFDLPPLSYDFHFITPRNRSKNLKVIGKFSITTINREILKKI